MDANGSLTETKVTKICSHENKPKLLLLLLLLLALLLLQLLLSVLVFHLHLHKYGASSSFLPGLARFCFCLLALLWCLPLLIVL